MTEAARGCTTCAWGAAPSNAEPCCGCKGFALWEPDNDAASAQALIADQRRLEWLLTVMSLDDDPKGLGGHRTVALGAALMLGKTGRDAVDYAMEGSP